jgi:hypothetical protein
MQIPAESLSGGRFEIHTDIFTVINLEYIPHNSRFFAFQITERRTVAT